MIEPLREVRAFVTAALVDPVPRDHAQPDAAVRRRRIVAAVTLVVGAAVLAYSLHIPPGDPRFYPWTIALAAVWTVGAFASGPLHVGHAWTRAGGLGRPVVQSLALAALLVGVFVLGALVAGRVPVLAESMEAVLDHLRVGSWPVVTAIALVNGAAEELFFRGALFAAVGRRHPVAVTTVIYALTTIGTGVPMLVVAGVVLGLVCAMQRRVTGGVLGPILLHLIWSISMILLLPPLLNLVR